MPSTANDTVVKQEELPTEPAKPLPVVSKGSNENESLKPQKGECRGEDPVVKRDAIQEKREDGVNSSNTIKKAPSSPSGRYKTTSGAVPPPPPPPPQQNPNFHNDPNHFARRPTGRFIMNVPGPMPNMNGPRMPFPMGRPYGAPPNPYGYPPGGNFGQLPPQYPHHHMMQMAFHQGGFPPSGPHPGQMKGNFPPMPPYGGPIPYGMLHTGHGYPPHPGMNPNFHHGNPIHVSSDMNLAAMANMNTRKKRTIEGIHSTHPINFNPYAFRRTDSSSTATSTVAGNNTSTETNDDSIPTANNSRQQQQQQQQPKQQARQTRHRRNYSGASTASSLSVGGFSISSYERNGSMDDQIMGDNPMSKYSPKRQRKNTLVVDTNMRPPSSLLQPADTQEQSSRFEQLSIEARRPASTDSNSSAQSNLFLSLSTSPINADVDSTPNMKNTAKSGSHNKSQTIFKSKNQDRPSDTPTPPVHGELGDSSMLNEEHSMLNSHLRGQSFTPLPHLSASTSAIHDTISPSNGIQPQLSWSIAGETPSLEDLDEWEEGSGKMRLESSKNRPNSATSTESKAMSFSPHEFQMWKEEHELADGVVSGTTTPLPVFFEQSGNQGTENKFGDQTNKNRREGNDQPMYRSSKKMEPALWKHEGIPGMPTTSVFEGNDYHGEAFPGHSPMHGDRGDPHMDYSMAPYAHHNERIRNLRGRVHPGGHYPPMPLHIPPHMAAHLPLASPMGIGKGGMWSPHHGMHLGSPHHLGSPLNAMAQSKRKCMPLKPPIPSKFQGDMEKVKNSPVPEFTSLVNFPSHMSQKQAVNLPEGMRCCVMCGQACPCSSGNKSKKSKLKGMEGGLAQRSSNGQDHLGDKSSGYAIIPTQNKGLCTLCDVNVWVVASSGLEIKWCKGCKNFRPWAAFGDKGLATKCLRCRERQREKYALQKEEKDKTRPVPKKQSSTK